MAYAQRINKNIVVSVDQQELGHTGTVTFTPIPGIVDLSPPAETADSTEVTVYSSEGKEYLPGMFDGGEVSIELDWDPSDDVHDFLRGMTAARTVHAFKILIPGLKEINFNAFGTGWTPKANKRGDVMTSSLAVKVTGVPIYADPV